MLLANDYLYLNNLDTTRILKGIKYLPAERDSILYWNSLFLQYMNDSAFHDNFYYSLVFQLQKAGFQVYSEAYWADFLKSESALVVSIAQQELEEYSYPYYQVGTFSDTVVYTSGIVVFGTGLNTWYELSWLNGQEPLTVLYHYTAVEDGIEGKFTWNPILDTYPYYYSRTDIDSSDVAALAIRSGQESGEMLFDFLMNNYINAHRKKPVGDYYYLHYDRDKKRLRLARDYRLQRISP
jgi:hypothetical protein